jgi:squalene-hopene/tetraprenyl-beta-curcumene cyclase
MLTNCALAGLVPWREVPSLPFEMTCLPRWASRIARVPAANYTLPALIATGQARFYFEKPHNPVTRMLRRASIDKSLVALERMQPESGGFFEATPLTSFVVMSLAAMNRATHPIVQRGVQFLLSTVREDGSWPIETNLSTWTTSLTLVALAAGGEDLQQHECLDWLLDCQQHVVHPVTGAAAGGWGWSDLPGAVPDAADTPAALLALERWIAPGGCPDEPRIVAAAANGIQWLLNAQQPDGGFPILVGGWGKRSADRSGADLTAHALRALAAWAKHLPSHPMAELLGRHQQSVLSSRVGYAPTGPPLRTQAATSSQGYTTDPSYEARLSTAIERGFAFLDATQRQDGSWIPLWFGNQDEAAEENPYYGTSRVLLAYRDLNRLQAPAAERGFAWLTAHQNADGGWGGVLDTARNGKTVRRSSVEETAVAVEALLAAPDSIAVQSALERGLEWLTTAVESGGHTECSPIGLFFAKLWYCEKLYPRIFTVSALGHALNRYETPAPREPETTHASSDLLEKAHLGENIVRPVAR